MVLCCSFPFFYVCICDILLTFNLFSFNTNVNWLPGSGSASPHGYSRQPVLKFYYRYFEQLDVTEKIKIKIVVVVVNYNAIMYNLTV